MNSMMPHLLELRTRLIYCIIAYFLSVLICYAWSESLFQFLAKPLFDLMDTSPKSFIYTDMTEALTTYIRLSCSAGLFLSFPFFAIQLWRFIAPGLYLTEKKNFSPFIIASTLLFYIGAFLVYYGILPVAWHFLMSFETVGTSQHIGITLQPKVNEYLSLVSSMTIAFGLAFQFPVAMVLLVRFGLVSLESFIKMRRYIIVAIFALAAILTPPDVFSQIMLAIPLLALFEAALVVSRIIIKNKR